MNWKEISQRLASLHEKQEAAVIRFSPESTGEMVNLSNDDFSLKIEGKKINAKKIRKFLWEQRKKRALQRKNAVLWSAYIKDEDKSYIGVGALTTKRVADKMAERNGSNIKS